MREGWREERRGGVEVVRNGARGWKKETEEEGNERRVYER